MSILSNMIAGVDTQIAGSQIALESAGEKGNAQNSFWDNVGDFFGLGTAGRQREFDAEQAAIDRTYQQNSAERAMQFEADQAQQNRNFQHEERIDQWNKEMEASNTAYQRAVKDLKAAGLNPILAAGNSASTPNLNVGSGSTASGRTGSGSRASGTKGGGEGLALLASIFESATSLMGGDLKYKGTRMGFGAKI